MNRLPRWAFRFLFTALVLAVLTGTALSFCIIRSTGWSNQQTVCCHGDYRWWHPATLPVPITINRTGSKQAPGELTAAAIRRAMATWSQVPSSYFKFSDAGLTDQNYSANDNINIVVFDVAGDNFAKGTTVLAFSRTITVTDNYGYRAKDSDMVFNARDYAWGNGPGTNEFDIETVALHEFGHHLGLDHTGGHRDISSASSGCGPVLTNAVMYYAVGQGSRKRVLQPDDIAGLTQIYPNWVIEGYVMDASTNAPLAGVELNLQGTLSPQDTITAKIVRTDAMGYFFSPVLNDQFILSISRYGYRYGGQKAFRFSQPETQLADFRLEPLPLGQITGSVSDAETGLPIQARIELLAEGQMPQSVATDVNGNYAFLKLPISDPVSTVYQKIRVEPELPYPLASSDQAIIVTENKISRYDFKSRPAQVLLVDADGGKSYENYFTESLTRLNQSYVVWETQRQGRPATAFPTFAQKPVIWFTGNERDNLMSAADKDSIRAHLSRGGSLFLSGQNIAEFLAASDSSFLKTVLHTRWGGNSRDVIVHGVSGDPVGDGLGSIALGGGDGAKNQTSQDLLIPLPPAQATILYDTTANATVAGLKIAEAIPGILGSRLVFFGFGVEGINSKVPGYATRDRVMSNVFSWLTGQATGVADQFETAEYIDQFELSPNFPNPFNHSTVIRFWLPATANDTPVTLVIYDVLGRQVRKLHNSSLLKTGMHMVSWDGRDDLGQSVASGIYVYKLSAAGFEQARKLLLIK